MAEIFISYKSERRSAAAHLAKILERYGYAVWFDYDLVKGEDFADEIDSRIRDAKAVIVLWCKLAVQSRWVKREAALASSLGGIVPVKIEPCDLRVDFHSDDVIDLSGWSGAPFDPKLYPLIDAIAHRVGREPHIDFKAMRAYEDDWRRFGAPSLKAFGLEAPIHAERESSPAPDPSPLPPADTHEKREQDSAGRRRFELEIRARGYAFTPYVRASALALIAAVAGAFFWENFRGGQGGHAASSPPLAAPLARETVLAEPIVRIPATPPEAAPKPARADPEPAPLRAAAVAPPKPAPAPAEEACDGLLVSVAMSGEKPCIKPGSGESFRDCPDCPEMVIVPSGSLLMGSPEGEEGRDSDEGPQHKVTIPKPFAVGRTHITRGQFAAFVKATGHKTDGGCKAWTGSVWKADNNASWRSPGFDQDDSHPAVCINWDDAKAYVAWLAKTTGEPYRLLSEAEAEYAARGGTVASKQPRYFFGDHAKDLCRYANGADETGKMKFPGWTVAPCNDGYIFTAPAMSFKPNAFGLYDMHGNAWSWVEDCYHGSYADAPTDGSAWTTGGCVYRVLRGGSWGNDPLEFSARRGVSSTGRTTGTSMSTSVWRGR